MSYYWFDRQELFQKGNDKYYNCGGKEKAAKYYNDNKEVLKEKAKTRQNKKKNQEENIKEIDAET